MRLGFLLSTSLLLIPLAAAGPITDGCNSALLANVCTSEYATGEGACAMSSNAYRHGDTTVYLYGDDASATIVGFAGCSSEEGYYSVTYTGVYASVNAADQHASFDWYHADYEWIGLEDYSDCYLALGAGGLFYGNSDCAVPAPPNPGWGALLP
jgi:hypothetical protein